MTLQWIDRIAGVAYICVRDQLPAFREFLNAIDQLITHPHWRPGMPIVKDVREWRGDPPAECAEEWRAYIAERRRFLEGCRLAVVCRKDDRRLVNALDAALAEVPAAVTLQEFSDMIHAHLWIQPRQAPSTGE
jgi:hypothetical protein